MVREASPQTPEGGARARSSTMTQSPAMLEVALPQLTAASPAPLTRSRASQLFAEHCDYVWNALRRLGVRHEDLEDLTHDTFVAVYKQWSGYDSGRPLRPWLFGFALRVASDHRRLARHRLEVGAADDEPHDDAPNAADLLLRKEREALAHAALATVELNRRAVFILHELDGSSVPEIAAAFEIPVATAYSRLRLAREDFAAAVKRLTLRER
jgi:RNA polymerase sigma-70 factor (ECF subfamily)